MNTGILDKIYLHHGRVLTRPYVFHFYFKSILFFFVLGINGISWSQENEPLPPKRISETEIADCGEPYYIGGHQALFNYIKKNLIVSDSCIQNINNTKLYVKLLIDTTGKVSNVELLKSEFITEQCRELITKIFYSMPNWNPGVYNGQPANRFLTLPIRIELD